MYDHSTVVTGDSRCRKVVYLLMEHPSDTPVLAV